MTEHSLTPRARIVVLIALLIVGVAYVGVFAWFKRNSVDFVERDQNRRAAASAIAYETPSFAWSFEAGSRAIGMLGSGWQLPGDEATWSQREGGVLYIPASVVAGEILEVRFDGHIDPQERVVVVTLDANGKIVGRWQLGPEHWHIIDRIALPEISNEAQPWRLQFSIHRRGFWLWRGFEPDLLSYGIRLRGLRTVDALQIEGVPAN